MRRTTTRGVACAWAVGLAALGPASASADGFDAPAGFYEGVTGTGSLLRSQLADRMADGHIQRRYGDLKDAAVILDAGPFRSRPGNLLTVYDRRSVDGTWDGGNTWNREHLWLQSRQDGSANDSTRGNLGDHHAVRPAVPFLNNSRGNEPFAGRGLTGGPRLVPGGFFAGDADKGDVARSLFYSATRYGLDLVDGEPSGNRMGDLDALLAWHYLDAPDGFERRRNHAVFSRDLNPSFFQNNRNAFVDRPEYAWSVFADQENDSRLSFAGADVDADGGSTLRLAETIYRDASPRFNAGTLGLVADGVDPTYYRVTAAGDLSIAFPSDDGGVDTLRAAIGPRDLDAAPESVSYQLRPGLSFTTGRKGGTFTLDNLDVTTEGGRGRGANDADDVFTYQLDVLDHPDASLAADAERPASSLDLGVVGLGGPAFTAGVSVFNRAADPAFTAELLADGATSTDARVAVGSFGTVAGGGVGVAPVTLSGAGPGATLGTVDASVRLGTREPTFNGQRSTRTLSLAVTGRVALLGDATLDNRVDARDAARYRANSGRADAGVAWTDADFDRDGGVDAADLSLFADGYGGFEDEGRPGSGRRDLPLADASADLGDNPFAGDGLADFLYDATSGVLRVDPDGASVWSAAAFTLAAASATGSPAAAWAFADFGDTLELTDRSAGAAATRSAFVLAVLGPGLDASAFSGARWFALGSDLARSAEVFVLVPEPGTLTACAIILVLAGGRRRGPARR